MAKPTCCPDASVTGTERPPTLNCLPAAVTCEMVTLSVPLLVRTTGKVLLPLTTTLPKEMLVGITDSSRVIPVPDRYTIVGEFVAVLLIETVPLTLPVEAGVNAAEKFAFWPGARARGNERPPTVKPAPLAVTCRTATGPMPSLVRRASEGCHNAARTLGCGERCHSCKRPGQIIY
jgi:hypothetical protein